MTPCAPPATIAPSSPAGGDSHALHGDSDPSRQPGIRVSMLYAMICLEYVMIKFSPLLPSQYNFGPVVNYIVEYYQ